MAKSSPPTSTTVQPIPIPHTPDENTFTLLTRAVALLAHAKSHIGLGAPIDGMIAIHGLDNCAEYILRILAQHLDMEAVAGKPFDTVEVASLAGDINRFVSEHYNQILPYTTDIKQLRVIRNLVQHGAVDPRAELRRFEVIVSRLYVKIFQQYFGLDPDKLRLSSLVSDSKVKSYLEKSEHDIDAKNYVESVVASRDAFEHAYAGARTSSDIRTWSIPAVLEMKNQTYLTLKYLEMVDARLEMGRLGIDSAQYERFKKYLRRIPHEYNAEPLPIVITKNGFDKVEAEFCYHFVSECVVRWQNAGFGAVLQYNPTNPLPFKQSSVFTIGDVSLDDEAQTGAYYLDDYGQIDTFIVGASDKFSLMQLPRDEPIEFKRRITRDAQPFSMIIGELEVINTNNRLVTNNPAQWEVAIHYQNIDLRTQTYVYRDGEMQPRQQSLNSMDAEALQNLAGGGVIRPHLAEAIIAHRSTIGTYKSVQQLLEVNGIHEGIVNYLTSYTTVRDDLMKSLPVQQ